MNRVQKQHNLDQIFYLKKNIGKDIFLAPVHGAHDADFSNQKKNQYTFIVMLEFIFTS